MVVCGYGGAGARERRENVTQDCAQCTRGKNNGSKMSSAALPPWKAREEIRLRRIVIEEGEGAKMFDGVDMGRLIVDLFAVQCSSHIIICLLQLLVSSWRGCEPGLLHDTRMRQNGGGYQLHARFVSLVTV